MNTGSETQKIIDRQTKEALFQKLEAGEIPAELNKYFNERELKEIESALKTATTVRDLQMETLIHAARIIFETEEGARLTQKRYQDEMLRGAYTGLDLEKHGQPYLIPDLQQLVRFFSEVSASQIPSNKTNKILVMGSGPGRLAPFELALAIKNGIQEVVFNDLLDFHIDATREKIKNAFGTSDAENIEGVKIQYQQGDILQVAEEIKNKFDAIFSWWFVTPEIADFTNVEQFHERRQKLYKTINSLLSKQGSFVEDIPLSEGFGFYYLLRLKTYVILRLMETLDGENKNMIITDYSNKQKIGMPYHIRFAPTLCAHNKEVESAGLSQWSSDTITLPSGITNFEDYNRQVGIGPQKLLNAIMGSNIGSLQKHLGEMRSNLLTYPDISDPTAKRKTTIAWKKSSTL